MRQRGPSSIRAKITLRSADDPVLKRFRAALEQMYGELIDRIVCCTASRRAAMREKIRIATTRYSLKT